MPASDSAESSPVRWGRATVMGAAVLAVLVLLVGFTPARQVLAGFLQIFRVRQFSVIPVDQERSSRLEEIARSMEGALPANPVVERKPAPPQPVGGAPEASAMAGFSVQIPAALPPGAILREFSVAQGPAVRVDFDRDRIQAKLDSLGFRDIRLPPMVQGSVRVDVPSVVSQRFEIPVGAGRDTSTIVVTQLRSPTVTAPSGLDPRALGEAYLRILGLSAEDAEKLGGQIDWTSTIVLPIPRNLASVQELQVNGSKAVLLQTNPQPPGHLRSRTLLWQKNDIVYAVHGQGVEATDLVRLAESLR